MFIAFTVTRLWSLDRTKKIWRLESKEQGEGPLNLYTRGNILPRLLWVRQSRLSKESLTQPKVRCEF